MLLYKKYLITAREISKPARHPLEFNLFFSPIIEKKDYFDMK